MANGSVALATVTMKKDIAFPNFAAAILSAMVFATAAATKKLVLINNL